MSVDLAHSLTPFTPEQIRLLKRFVTQVDKLSASQFLKDSTEPIELKAELVNGQVENLRLAGPGREALDAISGTFRELYGGGKGNRTSAKAISKLIGEHADARATAAGEKLAKALKQYRAALAYRDRVDPRMGILVEDPTDSSSIQTPQQVIDVFLNGDLLHYELVKADELEDDPRYTEMLMVMLNSAIRDFAVLWQKLAVLVKRIIDDPIMVSSQATPG
jgi:hypothetical protein